MVTMVANAAGPPLAGGTAVATDVSGSSSHPQQTTTNGQSIDTRAIKNGIYTAYAPSVPYSLRRAPALDMNTVERRGTAFAAKEVKRTRPNSIQEAPTYRPTAEEFKEPFRYIEKIRAEAEQYGICKIIPPDSWLPDFDVDTERFFFKTRRQELNSVEGNNRTNVQYLDQLAKYHKQHGMNLNRFPSVDKRPLDLYKLKKAVECRGGFDKVCKHKKWAEIGRDLGYSGKIMSSLSTSLKNSYQKWLHPYEEFVRANKAGSQHQQQQKPQQEYDTSSPYTPASTKQQTNGSHQGTPSHLDNHSPAISASQSLNASLNGNANPPDHQVRPAEAPARAPSGFTPVNPGGFTPVNAGPASFTPVQKVATPDHNSSNGNYKIFPALGSNGQAGNSSPHDSSAAYQNGHSTNPNPLKRSWDQDSKPMPSFREGTISFDSVNQDKKVKKAPNVLGSHMSQPRPVAQRMYSNPQNGKKGEVCDVCGLKDEKASFITCYGCDTGYHKGCLDPPARLSDARADWHCPKCLIGTGEFGFEEGGHYSLKQFQDKARLFKDHHFEARMPYDPIKNQKRAVTEDDVEREFWRLVESPAEEVEVEYGADIHSTTAGSGFPSIEKNPTDPYSTDPWNLNVLPYHADSLFKHINTDISGMTIPWLYVGMCFSTFCWHNEDHYCYSANYQHFGATKTWYGIPGSDADAFETAMKEAVPELFAAQPDLLSQLVTLLPPERLKKAGVNVYAADQRAGQFVITFPQAYHAGFNHGFNFNEAVNFAPSDWEPFGNSNIRRMQENRKPPCFAHDELLVTAAKRDSSIKTAKWLAPALQRTIAQEQEQRDKFLIQHKENLGPHKCNIDKSGDVDQPCKMELEIKDIELPEHEYQCDHCKSYTYFSSFHCTVTGKVMCLQHAGHIPCCGAQELHRYQGEKHVLRYRFNDEALQDLVQKVVDRASLPEAWQERLSKALDDEEKPALKTLQTLVNEGERIPWELDGLEDLKTYVAKCNEWVEEAQNYITRKQQNRRKNDRAWRKSKSSKADDNNEKEKEARKVDNIFRLLSLAEELSFDCPQITTLQERSDAIADFQTNARTALANPAQVSTQDLEDLAESGKGFNVDIPEVDRLEILVKQHRWSDEVSERVRAGGSPFRTLKEVKAKLEKGAEIGMSREDDMNMLRLKDLVHNGSILEDKAVELMSAEVVHHGQLEAIASQADRLPLSEETRSKMDGILSKQREAQKAIESFVRRSLDPDFSKRPKYKEAREAMDGFTDLTTKPQGAADLESAVKRQENWMRKGKKLFGKANAPLHILQQHLDYVMEHNSFCFDLTDRPRMPVEPASRENSPADADEGDEGVKSEKNVFCMCRQPESGTMLECELCLEWYHSKCLKIARGKVKEDDKYNCPICDYRVKIPRDAARPKLEDLVSWQDEIAELPFQPEEEDTLTRIINTAQAFRDFLRPHVNPMMTNPTEVTTQRFYLRKIEGAEILLSYETNFFRQEVHKWAPVADQPPPILEVSNSTRKPRPTKQQKLMQQHGVSTPEELPLQFRTKSYVPAKSRKGSDARIQPTMNKDHAGGNALSDPSKTNGVERRVPPPLHALHNGAFPMSADYNHSPASQSGGFQSPYFPNNSHSQSPFTHHQSPLSATRPNIEPSLFSGSGDTPFEPAGDQAPSTPPPTTNDFLDTTSPAAVERMFDECVNGYEEDENAHHDGVAEALEDREKEAQGSEETK